MENTELKIASHYNFESATLYVKCEEKDGSLYWYGDNSDNLVTKTVSRCKRGTGCIKKTFGNPWKRISKKAAAEILAKYGITAEQFIAYTNEEPELMSELAAQRAEEERVETLNFFLSKPLTSNEALEVATQAEIAMSEMASKCEVTSATQITDTVNTEVTEITAEDDGSNDDPDEDNGEVIDTPEIAAQVEEKNRPALTTVTIERTEEKMAISMPTIGAANKGKQYIVDGMKKSKATAELVIQSYARQAIEDGSTIEIDTRLANEFKTITSSPYKGEFSIVYTDKDGKPVEVAAEKQSMSANGVDTTPYHVEIKMYGDKVPMFEILQDGKHLASRRSRAFSKSEADEWIIKAYQMREQYPNMTIEVPEVIAALYLDSLACNPRIVRELNVNLTSFEMKGEPIEESNEHQINEYAIIYGSTPAAIDAAIQAEIELATPNFFKGKAQIVYPVQEPKNFTAAQSNLPSGDITVESGAEAFALVAKYFPSGLEFDGIDYGYRGETHFCFFNDSANLSLIALSDESNRRIEEVRVQEGGNIRLAVIIESKKNVDKPLVKTSNVEKTAEKKKAADDAEKNLKTSQKTVAADKSQRWLENAKTDVAGRYYIVPELAYKNFEANANWNPCFYIVTNDLKLKRVGLKFAVALATLGQAIEISKNDVATLKK